MVKSISLAVLGLLSSVSVFADWSGDILCVQPTQAPTEHALVADALGRVYVKYADGETKTTVKLSSLRLFSEHGSKRGTAFKRVAFDGTAGDGNDSFIADTRPVKTDSIIQEIQFDLSSLDRDLSTVKTTKGNSYVMDCVIRKD